MHIASFFKLFLLENVIDMACDYSAVTLKQLGHLRLIEPYGLIFNPYIQ